jgi:hypothetical protein
MFTLSADGWMNCAISFGTNRLLPDHRRWMRWRRRPCRNIATAKQRRSCASEARDMPERNIDDPKSFKRERVGVGSYESAADQKGQKRRRGRRGDRGGEGAAEFSGWQTRLSCLSQSLEPPLCRLSQGRPRLLQRLFLAFHLNLGLARQIISC